MFSIAVRYIGVALLLLLCGAVVDFVVEPVGSFDYSARMLTNNHVEVSICAESAFDAVAVIDAVNESSSHSLSVLQGCNKLLVPLILESENYTFSLQPNYNAYAGSQITQVAVNTTTISNPYYYEHSIGLFSYIGTSVNYAYYRVGEQIVKVTLQDDVPQALPHTIGEHTIFVGENNYYIQGKTKVVVVEKNAAILDEIGQSAYDYLLLRYIFHSSTF